MPETGRKGIDGVGPSVFMAVDRGNTRLKATVICGREVVDSVKLEATNPDVVLELCERHRVESAAMLSVGGVDVRLVETLRNAVDDNFLLLTSKTEIPIEVDGYPRELLGADRVAAAAGAALLYPGRECVVVDAGTAMTIDLLTAGGRFAGGTISPGVSLRLDSLHKFTSLLPEVAVSRGDAPRRWARTTREAMLSGAVGGVMDQIACSMREGALTLLTGGDAAYLYKQITDDGDFAGKESVRYEPHLVAFGLQYIYTEHEKNL